MPHHHHFPAMHQHDESEGNNKKEEEEGDNMMTTRYRRLTTSYNDTMQSIPVHGYIPFDLCIDPDPSSGYGFFTGSGPGLTCNTPRSTHAIS